MASGPPTRALTKAEFEHLLQQAAERDVPREPRLFTLAELVAAAQEIDIDPVSVEEVYGEYQRAQAQPVPARRPPLGTRVQLRKVDDVLQLLVPPLRGRYLPLKTAALSGLASLPCVGLLALGMNPLLALLSMAVVPAVAYVAYEHGRTPGQELWLRRDGSGTLMRFLRRKTTESHPLVAGQVHARLARLTEHTDQGLLTFQFVALDHGTHTHALLEGYSHPEQVWVIEEIERWLGR
jgi:hypothetical protein